MTYRPIRNESLKKLLERLTYTFSVQELQYLRRFNPATARTMGRNILLSRGVVQRDAWL